MPKDVSASVTEAELSEPPQKVLRLGLLGFPGHLALPPGVLVESWINFQDLPSYVGPMLSPPALVSWQSSALTKSNAS